MTLVQEGSLRTRLGLDGRLPVLQSDLLGHSNFYWLPKTPPDHMLYTWEAHQGEPRIVHVKDVAFGGPKIVLMAGPCALENEAQIWESAIAAKMAGATTLRGGAFKPRTSPYSFMGLGRRGLEMQREVADYLGMLVVTEATSEKNLPLVAQYADIIQLGARNAQQFELLAAAGQVAKSLKKAILYKRGPWMSLKDWMLGLEYILASGCQKVILCERGTKMPSGQIDFDDQGVRDVRKLTPFPIIGDPTHATEKAANVSGLAERALKAGVDGLLIETHPHPDQALCDGPRALLPEQLLQVANDIDAHTPPGKYFRQSREEIL